MPNNLPVCLAALIIALFFSNATAGPVDSARFKTSAAKAYNDAKQKYDASPASNDLAIQLGRAAYDWADFAADSSARREIAEAGISACRSLLQRDPRSVGGHYYLAMDLGQLARTKKLGALPLVSEMETEFKKTVDLDPHFDYAGPDRNLGLLYRDAPGWPASIGSRGKAHEHLLQACALAPEYPENWLNLVESDFKWGERSTANTDFKKLQTIWANAQKKFTGEPWESSWDDWNKRMDVVKRKVSKIAEPPRKFSD